jgi:hypothetical protein
MNTGEFYQTFKEEYQYSSNFSRRQERERTLPNLFCEASIPVIPKLDKNTTKKRNYRPISLTNTHTKYLQTKFNNTSKRLYTMINLVSFQESKGG